MHIPPVKYLVSSPCEDVPVDSDRLDLPLECDPSGTPYRIYFQSIKNLIERDGFDLIGKAANKRCAREVDKNEIAEIVVRAEKHGTLYHPASLELVLREGSLKFGLNVAFSETGRNWLKKEFSVIQKINTKCKLPYLPEVYFFHEEEPASFLLEDWFDGYHEFHISENEGGRQVMRLWEFGMGYRNLSAEQSFEIYRQASKILTLYYDPGDFSQIHPWHHAAGDFIASVEDGGIDVRLTTAREYDPYMVFQEKKTMNPVIALFYFLLNLIVRMRLDRLDGVGNIVWAEDFCLEASTRGFLEGLRLKGELKKYFTSETDFFDVVKSFRPEDLKAAYGPLVDLYGGTGDHPVITANLEKHVEALYATLQNFPS
jgi:hypothetical protein